MATPALSWTPSARVAMIGAGQLARMTQQAAVDLDIALHVLALSPSDPAVLAGAAHQLGSHTDPAALSSFALTGGAGEVVTFDHELVPPAVLADLEARGAVLRPSAAALLVAQDKLHARRLLAGAGHPVPAFEAVGGPSDVARFAGGHGWPVVLKARSGGYDGRGVLVVGSVAEIPPDLPWGGGGGGGVGAGGRGAAGGVGAGPEPAWLVEEHVSLAAELAVLVARSPSGATVTYPVVQTTQTDGICRWLVAPAAGVAPAVRVAASELATRIVREIGATGICAVELFVDDAGRVLVNELALRPHNSGHATIEANVTSQFHNHLRAVLDWPLGTTDLVAPAAAMVNLITPTADIDLHANLPAALGAVPAAHVHLYAKAARPERKVGHVTALGSSTDEALGAASEAAGILLRR